MANYYSDSDSDSEEQQRLEFFKKKEREIREKEFQLMSANEYLGIILKNGVRELTEAEKKDREDMEKGRDEVFQKFIYWSSNSFI